MQDKDTRYSTNCHDGIIFSPYEGYAPLLLNRRIGSFQLRRAQGGAQDLRLRLTGTGTVRAIPGIFVRRRAKVAHFPTVHTS